MSLRAYLLIFAHKKPNNRIDQKGGKITLDLGDFLAFCRELPKKNFCYSCGQPKNLIEGGYGLLELSGLENNITIKATPYIHCLVLKNGCAEITLIGNFGVIITDKYRIGAKPDEEENQHIHHVALLDNKANIALILGEKMGPPVICR